MLLVYNLLSVVYYNGLYPSGRVDQCLRIIVCVTIGMSFFVHLGCLMFTSRSGAHHQQCPEGVSSCSSNDVTLGSDGRVHLAKAGYICEMVGLVLLVVLMCAAEGNRGAPWIYCWSAVIWILSLFSTYSFLLFIAGWWPSDSAYGQKHRVESPQIRAFRSKLRILACLDISFNVLIFILLFCRIFYCRSARKSSSKAGPSQA